MNLTFKQLEAFYCALTLGSFSAAAARLHTTQSAISKRVAELEEDLGERLLHRMPQGLLPTAAGHRLLPLARQTLQLRERIASEIRPGRQLHGTFKLGVTELTALTWLTRLIQSLHADHPELVVEPVVDAGLHLFEALKANRIDIALLPGSFWGEGYSVREIGRVDDPWMASPSLDIPRRPLKPAEFAPFTALEQSAGSAKGRFYAAWRAQHGFRFHKALETNSLTVLRELTIAGMGITQLPLAYFLDDIAAGLIRVVESDPAPPPMAFSAVWHQDQFNPALQVIADRAAAVCDFHRPPAHRGAQPQEVGAALRELTDSVSA
ncbi:LysR family transcriptional regulator [Xylophilus rhododendri]|uniref:LysR family transcriptional regulator n=1 Tax=Xylophilus rhododendri TaxID=2697032 RepID=A0A857J9S5_9BURK|nr:LysR family transcriptional regulator [Xylophilus rhododendri]QHJ00478.1 LysR family transcriptional regulator [Xylophilus rhododendri]